MFARGKVSRWRICFWYCKNSNEAFILSSNAKIQHSVDYFGHQRTSTTGNKWLIEWLKGETAKEIGITESAFHWETIGLESSKTAECNLRFSVNRINLIIHNVEPLIRMTCPYASMNQYTDIGIYS